ncbi:MAG TPA: CocE/NonD family hydrolase, partial [Anaerolineales bacterium]
SDSPADSYIYDPRDPTPAVGGPLMNLQGGQQDNWTLEAREDVLTFTSPPLERDLEVIGTVRLKLYVRSSLENTDFFGRLCEVHPDGRSINVCDGMLRVEPGLGDLQPDGSLCLVIELWATANNFRRGHCLRLQVSSGAFPRWDRNLGSGEPLADGTRMFPAHQTVYHDRNHPSELILPVTR